MCDVRFPGIKSVFRIGFEQNFLSLNNARH